MELRDEIFTYGLRQKRLNLLYLILGGSVLVFFMLFSVFYIDIHELAIYQHVVTNIFGLTLLGMFYVAFFGGLFFITLPIEIIFLNALNTYNPALVFLATIFGLLISYSLDYLIGHRLSGLSKKLISVKQFYKIKTQINKRGALAVFILNFIGFGSQQATLILGVFKYNKLRLLLIAASAQLLKYILLVAGFIIYNNIYIR